MTTDALLSERLSDPAIVDRLEATDYYAAQAAFQWPTPSRFNIADAICGWWARRAPDRIALRAIGDDGSIEDWTYQRLERSASALANALAAMGVKRGMRCGVLLGQRPETPIAHIALYKLGAVALPLFAGFGAEALAPRLRDSGAKFLITEAGALEKIAEIRDQLEEFEDVLCVDGPGAGALDFWDLIHRAADQRAAVATRPDDPAFVSYTSGTTGSPKGALHGHHVLIGHLPSVQMWLEGFPRPGDVVWTPADWAWMGGLTNIMMPSLLYGEPLIARRFAKFDPDRALELMARMGVTVGFIPPTALKMLRAESKPSDAALRLRAVGAGGESLGAELLEWGREELGVTINEFYGQTECNLILSSSGQLMAPRANSMGRASLGAEVAVIDAQGDTAPNGVEGEIAVRHPHPAMMLEYWRNPEATAAKFIGDWMRTGDQGIRDEDGYFYFKARADDVITSAGYRIGPGEIEECLAGHPAVAIAGVFGAPDPVRGEGIIACVTLRAGVKADPSLADQLRQHVRVRLGGHETPREVCFQDALPMTATGKILRRELKRRYHSETTS